jgi:hypothetical protein
LISLGAKGKLAKSKKGHDLWDFSWGKLQRVPDVWEMGIFSVFAPACGGGADREQSIFFPMWEGEEATVLLNVYGTSTRCASIPGLTAL